MKEPGGHQPLVSIERQYETDLATGETRVRMFVKMYFEARDSGLLADIGDVLWRTLSCIATYMNADGYSCPSQARIASDLGITRQQANRRLKALAEYRFQGRPVIRVEKSRRNTSKGGRWANNVYQIQPISGFGIFADGARKGGEPTRESPMSRKCYIGGPVSEEPVSGPPDTNKSHSINQTHTQESVCGRVEEECGMRPAESLVRRFHRERGHSTRRVPTRRELACAEELVGNHGSEGAGYILDFALSRGRATHFQMENFGAVMLYVDDALLHRAREQSRRDRLMLPRRADDYEDWRRRKLSRLREKMCIREIAELDEAVRSDLSAEYPNPEVPGFELLVRSRVDSLIAAQHDVTRAEFDRDKARKREASATRRAS